MTRSRLATPFLRCSPIPLLGCALVLAGWTHLTGPLGPDFPETLIRRHAPVSQGSLSDAQLRQRRIGRLRRELAVNGFRLMISRRRVKPLALGGFLVVDVATGRAVVGGAPAPFSATLEAIEEWAQGRGGGHQAAEHTTGYEALTADQCAAGRRLLGWSPIRLSARASVTEATVRNLEAGLWVRPEAVTAIRAAVEAAGVEFIAGNEAGLGVRLRRKELL